MAEKRADRRTGTTTPGGDGGAGGGRRRSTARSGETAAPREPAKTGRGGSSPARAEAGRAQQPDLRRDLRDFASGRPEGWQHEDWLNFLESLQNRGHNIADREAIGVALEKERLDLALGAVKGVGPQRRQALIDRFGTVWSLRNAEVDEIASTGKMPRDLAERVKSELH